MTLSTFQPSTSIRPLGEEHLRMFRRAIGPSPEAVIPRMALPEEAFKRPKLEFIGPELVKIDDAKRLTAEKGARLPTIQEVIFAIRDEKQYEAIIHKRFWISDLRSKLHDTCRINYAAGRLEEVSHEEWASLRENQRATALKGKGPLALHFDIRGFRVGHGLNLGGYFTDEYVAQAAILKEVIK